MEELVVWNPSKVESTIVKYWSFKQFGKVLLWNIIPPSPFFFFNLYCRTFWLLQWPPHWRSCLNLASIFFILQMIFLKNQPNHVTNFYLKNSTFKWDYALFEYQVVLMHKTRMWRRGKVVFIVNALSHLTGCQVFSVQQNLFPASPGKFRTFLWKWKCFSSHSYCIFLKPLFKEWIILKILLGVSSWHAKYNARSNELAFCK